MQDQVRAGQLRTLEASDAPRVAALIERCSDFYETLLGLPPGPAETQSLFYAGLDRVGESQKVLLCLERPDGALAAVVDCLAGYPDAETWTIGLLLVDPEHRKQGIGRGIVRKLEEEAAREGARVMRVSCTAARDRDGLAFWRRLGFEEEEPQQGAPETATGVPLTIVRKLLRSHEGVGSAIR